MENNKVSYNKERYKDYLPLVNHPEFFLFIKLIEAREVDMITRMYNANTSEDMFRCQGALKELKELKRIKEHLEGK